MEKSTWYVNGSETKDTLTQRKKLMEQRSDIAQEIISHRADFAEKWGLYIFLVILVLIIISSWVIRYPDYVEAKGILTADNAPKEIISRQEGRLVRLLVKNNENVELQQPLGWIESNANHQEVLDLSKRLDSSYSLLVKGTLSEIPRIFDIRYHNLGEVQQRYQKFVNELQIFNDYMINGFYGRKKQLLKDDINTLSGSIRFIGIQKSFAEQDVEMATLTFNMNKSLWMDKVLSDEELRVERSKFINKQMSLPQMENSLLASEMQKRSKIMEVQQIEHDMDQQTQIFIQAVQSFKSEVDDWKRKYILQSPVAGRVFFVLPIQEKQQIAQSRILGYIIPDDTRYYVELNLPQHNFGKIDTGMKVQLRFDAYPYQEVGYVEGTLEYVSRMASDSGFLSRVRLDKGLVTTGNHTIAYSGGLKLQAVVITKEMRLLQRFYYNTVKSMNFSK